MRIPTIHKNGTSAQSLMDAHGEAAARLKDAIDALCAAAPNGRDFYPQGQSAITEATREHQSRIDRLQSVYREIEELFFAIDQQVAA